ncbi:hypothetical protein C1I60_14035 [Paenibacillus terrae]|uniref:Uncharacterized protein n=2 Tax=Paenibacillus terrae TaxID=159743 RepID=A0A4U2PV00_9BACL|nr:hypothetical protein C1I60_14035 [Paenibacillus terrae]
MSIAKIAKKKKIVLEKFERTTLGHTSGVYKIVKLEGVDIFDSKKNVKPPFVAKRLRYEGNQLLFQSIGNEFIYTVSEDCNKYVGGIPEEWLPQLIAAISENKKNDPSADYDLQIIF